MTKLEFRVARLESRVPSLWPAPPLGFYEHCQELWATDPEGFRRSLAENPDTRLADIMTSPIPMKILRCIAFDQIVQEERQRRAEAKARK